MYDFKHHTLFTVANKTINLMVHRTKIHCVILKALCDSEVKQGSLTFAYFSVVLVRVEWSLSAGVRGVTGRQMRGKVMDRSHLPLLSWIHLHMSLDLHPCNEDM